MKFYKVKVEYGPGHMSKDEFWMEFADGDKKECIDERIKNHVETRFHYTSQLCAKWRKCKPPIEYFDKRIKACKEMITYKKATINSLEKFKKENFKKEE